MGFQAAKEFYFNLALHLKREHYLCKNNFKTIDEIPTWSDFFMQNASRLLQAFTPLKETGFQSDEQINEKISLWNGDITTLEIDAVVNAANSSLQGGDGVDGAIHAAAGIDLLKECQHLNGCETGAAKITGGYKLPAKYVIHTVGPQTTEPDKLISCYEKCLELMVENELKTIAFPCISTGVYGYPREQAADIAVGTVRNFFENNHNKVDRIIFCTFLQADHDIYEDLLQKFFPINGKMRYTSRRVKVELG